ncbi:MAG TPA: hypothetical protein VMW57_07520 [Methyloceanibacter sp.]|nr:hypothetical protein [Methyloceanibacter sp.]
MRLGAGGWILACCVVMMSGSALAVSLSASLKNYYAEFEIVLQCEEQAQLSEADADAAEAAIEEIEAYYLKKDPSIDKDHLLKQAVADKDEGFRILARSGVSGLRPYCRQSLHELLTKAKEIGPVASGQ